ncbi:proline-rich transmembrane protein 4 [Girardinichthys multiradiatus]|uniref:proline-rich transmembrane protein 4 n=1 Tax=Girardinichthys multiradiatus TaxID=208333 RepID=UPI001FADCAF3|nr:proline-rich transmembrane protein 4 [Girardinichthys multiradiatus]
MGSLWNIYLLFPLSFPLSLHAAAFTEENAKDRQETDNDRAMRFLTQPVQKPHQSSLAQESFMFRSENVEFPSHPLSWPLSSSEDLDRQGVIGEYSDIQEGTETSLLYHYDGGLTSRPLDILTEDTTLMESAQTSRSSSGKAPYNPTKKQTFNFLSTDESRASTEHPAQIRQNEPTLQNEISDIHFASPFSDSLSSPILNWNSTSSPFIGPNNNPEQQTPSPTINNEGWTKGIPISTQGKQNGTNPISDTILIRETVSTDGTRDESKILKATGSLLHEGNMDLSTTPCKTSDQSWTPTYPEDFTPSEPLLPSLALSPSLLVPLYSDWNSAFATWGFAWEAHIYGLGSVFTLICLISVVCLLGLPLRCPPGIGFFIMLHFFILAFAGIQGFGLLYDAYSSQDRLPLLVTQLLSELPMPCLISAFSLAFFLLSLHSRSYLSLPLAISTSFSALPKPCFLLCVCLLHFMISLGCVGLLQFFHSLPTVIILFPQGLFVFLTIFLSFSYLVFYCLKQVNTKHIYRLNDNGETGGSPEVVRPVICPFSKVEDWNRAAGAGIGSSLCLLGCGGLQLYGILHALGFDGVAGFGFQPWPWWGYQIGCRFCEIGACLGLCIIGTHPLFCNSNSALQTLSKPRPGSWSRLSCSSPLRGHSVPSQEEANSPALSTHESWSQIKQEKLVVCDVDSKKQSEALPLCSVVDNPAIKVDLANKYSLSQSTLPLHTPQNPPNKSKNADEFQLSTLYSVGTDSDSTVDLRPPSPIDLSRSIDQALFSESLFSHSIFSPQRLFHTSSSVSLSSPGQGTLNQGPICVGETLYRASSCGDVDQENAKSSSRASQPQGSLMSHRKAPMLTDQTDFERSIMGSTQGLCNYPKQSGKLRSNSWTNRGQNIAQSSFPRGIPSLSYHRRYRTLSLASQNSQGSDRIAATKHLSESKQLEWDIAVQAEFVNVCKQIDALSMCSDTIEL